MTVRGQDCRALAGSRGPPPDGPSRRTAPRRRRGRPGRNAPAPSTYASTRSPQGEQTTTIRNRWCSHLPTLPWLLRASRAHWQNPRGTTRPCRATRRARGETSDRPPKSSCGGTWTPASLGERRPVAGNTPTAPSESGRDRPRAVLFRPVAGRVRSPPRPVGWRFLLPLTRGTRAEGGALSRAGRAPDRAPHARSVQRHG